MEFEDFLKKGSVKKQEKNIFLAKALIKSSEKSLKNLKRIKVDDLNAEMVISECYGMIRELIEAKMALQGYKSYSHEATILFLKKFYIFNEKEMFFLDDLRKIRNGIKYYGREADKESAIKTLNFAISFTIKLKKIFMEDLEKNE